MINGRPFIGEGNRFQARESDEQDLFSWPRNVIMKTSADVIDYPIAVPRLAAMKLRNATLSLVETKSG